MIPNDEKRPSSQPERRNDQRNRHEQQESQHDQKRPRDRQQQVITDQSWRITAKRQILAVLVGAVAVATMMVQVMRVSRHGNRIGIPQTRSHKTWNHCIRVPRMCTISWMNDEARKIANTATT